MCDEQRIAELERQLVTIEQFFKGIDAGINLHDFSLDKLRISVGQWLFGRQKWKLLNDLFDILRDNLDQLPTDAEPQPRNIKIYQLKISGDKESVDSFKTSESILETLGRPFLIDLNSNQIVVFIESANILYLFLKLCNKRPDKKRSWILEYESLCLCIDVEVFNV